ncbi:MAG: hypothetical protein KGI25_05280 [Thaumarchaeota archaeon]|nr:hypothetical protein [Nitrososphaerota archaeon]
MVNIFSLGLAKEIITRVVAITAIYSIISYIVILRRDATNPNQLGMAIPLLFVTFGLVLVISILYCLRKYRVMNVK